MCESSPLGLASHTATVWLQLWPSPAILTNFSPVGDQDWTRHQVSCADCPCKGKGQEEHSLSMHTPTNFLQLILAPIMTLYLPISLLTSTTLALLVTSTLISSAYAVYLATLVDSDNVKPRRTGFAFNLCKNGSNARMATTDNPL